MWRTSHAKTFASSLSSLPQNSKLLKKWASNFNQGFPLMGRKMLEYFEPEQGKCFLDLTADLSSNSEGLSGRSRLLAEHCQMSRFESRPDIRLLANDCRVFDKEDSKDTNNENSSLPVQFSRMHYFFSDLCQHLLTADINPDSVDGIVIDCNHFVSDINESTELDMRYDKGQLRPDMPTASEFFMLSKDIELQKVLKTYGGLATTSKVAASAIVEARYLGNIFQTVGELQEALQPAGRILSENMNDLGQSNTLSSHLVQRSLEGARLFVNDHINELEFALRVVAENFLKFGTGILFVIASNAAEEKLVRTALNVAVVPSWKLGHVRQQPHHLNAVKESPWQVIEEKTHFGDDQGEMNKNTLFVARRTHYQRNSDDLVL